MQKGLSHPAYINKFIEVVTERNPGEDAMTIYMRYLAEVLGKTILDLEKRVAELEHDKAIAALSVLKGE